MSNTGQFTVLLLLLITACTSFMHHGSASTSLGCPDHVRISTLLSTSNVDDAEPHVPNILLVECGFGNDSHGQNATKAAMRACRNAIEFNSLSINKMVPGGYDAMKLNVILGVPAKYQDTLSLDDVSKVFPYGEIRFIIQDGGLIAPSGRLIESLGDKNEDMLIVCAAIQVGY